MYWPMHSSRYYYFTSFEQFLTFRGSFILLPCFVIAKANHSQKGQLSQHFSNRNTFWTRKNNISVFFNQYSVILHHVSIFGTNKVLFQVLHWSIPEVRSSKDLFSCCSNRSSILYSEAFLSINLVLWQSNNRDLTSSSSKTWR